MPEDCLRVSIDEVVDGSAILQFRVSDDIANVESALGTHVAWPANLVVERSYQQKPTPSKKKVEINLFEEKKVRDVASLPTSLSALHFVMEKSYENDKGMRVTIPFEVFGIDIVVWLLLSEDVVPLCNLNPITGNCIVVYVWHLYQMMKDTKLKDKFLYVNPFSICVKLLKIEDRARALADRLLIATLNQLVLVPCNLGIHWIITIIDPHKDKVYLLDPLSHRNRDRNWAKVVDTAMNIFKGNNGVTTNIRKSSVWKIIQGPIQDDGKKCGFYVMRFMKEIVKAFENDNSCCLTSMLWDKKYSNVQIDEIRGEWATCVIQHGLSRNPRN